MIAEANVLFLWVLTVNQLSCEEGRAITIMEPESGATSRLFRPKLREVKGAGSLVRLCAPIIGVFATQKRYQRLMTKLAARRARQNTTTQGAASMREAQ